jgi:hypothetical protein
MNKYYRQSRRKGMSYKPYKEGRLTGLVTSCIQTAFCNMSLKERHGRIEATRRQETRHKQLLDNLKDNTGHWKLKEEALDSTLWRTCFGRGYGPVVRQKNK